MHEESCFITRQCAKYTFANVVSIKLTYHYRYQKYNTQETSGVIIIISRISTLNPKECVYSQLKILLLLVKEQFTREICVQFYTQILKNPEKGNVGRVITLYRCMICDHLISFLLTSVTDFI